MGLRADSTATGINKHSKEGRAPSTILFSRAESCCFFLSATLSFVVRSHVRTPLPLPPIRLWARPGAKGTVVRSASFRQIPRAQPFPATSPPLLCPVAPLHAVCAACVSLLPSNENVCGIVFVRPLAATSSMHARSMLHRAFLLRLRLMGSSANDERAPRGRRQLR